MKVAIFSESPTDDAVHRIFVDALLGEETEIVDFPLRTREGGWHFVRKNLHSVYLALYYNSNADGLVTIVDSNHSVIHNTEHEAGDTANPDCRLCILRNVLKRARPREPVANRSEFKVAIGLAVPAIEAWFPCGTSTSESEWQKGLDTKKYSYDKWKLKVTAYGTDHLVSGVTMKKGVEHARRAVERLDDLEARFPGGFGALAREIRSWRTT